MLPLTSITSSRTAVRTLPGRRAVVLEKHERASGAEQSRARPKVSRTTREARQATGRPDASDDQASHGDPRGGGAGKPRTTSRRHLRTVGPFVSHFSGRVVQVFGTTQRPKPSTAPLQAAVFLFFVAITLPYAVALLPVLVLLLIVWLWLRRRGWVGRGLRFPRLWNRSASDAGLLVTSFRVRVSRDDGATEEPREIDCRLVRGADLGPAPLVGGEHVTGRGRRTSQGVVEVSWLGMPDTGTNLRTTSPKSWLSVLVSAGVIVAVGAAVLYIRRSQIPPVDVGAILNIVGLVLGILLLGYLIKIVFRRIF